MKSLVMAQLKPEFTKLGTEVTINDSEKHKGVVVTMPFYDPLRLRTHPASERA
jgi:aminomethyltransferase